MAAILLIFLPMIAQYHENLKNTFPKANFNEIIGSKYQMINENTWLKQNFEIFTPGGFYRQNGITCQNMLIYVK